MNENTHNPTDVNKGTTSVPVYSYSQGVINELAADASSGTVIIYPMAVDNSGPLNHLPTNAAYAIIKFSDDTPNNTLPSNITQYSFNVPPIATIVYDAATNAQNNTVPNLTPTYIILNTKEVYYQSTY